MAYWLGRRVGVYSLAQVAVVCWLAQEVGSLAVGLWEEDWLALDCPQGCALESSALLLGQTVSITIR